MTTAGLKRALGYFVRQAEIYVLCIIGGSFALAVYMQIINGNGIAQMFQSVPLVDLWISGVAVFTIDVSSYQYCYSMPVSFGCLRKHAFFGTLAMNILVIAQGLLFYFLSSGSDCRRKSYRRSTYSIFVFAVGKLCRADWNCGNEMGKNRVFYYDWRDCFGKYEFWRICKSFRYVRCDGAA